MYHIGTSGWLQRTSWTSLVQNIWDTHNTTCPGHSRTQLFLSVSRYAWKRLIQYTNTGSVHTHHNRGFRWMKSSTRASTIHVPPKKPPVSWVTSKEVLLAGQRGDCPRLLLWDSAHNTVFYSEAPNIRRHSVWVNVEEGCEDDLRAGAPLLQKTG